MGRDASPKRPWRYALPPEDGRLGETSLPKFPFIVTDSATPRRVVALMKRRIYIETTVISYLTARPSRDLVLAGRQEITREYWPRLIQEFDVFISLLVLQEAERGDPEAVRKRLDIVADLPVLDVTVEVDRLSQKLIQARAIPTECSEDAIHVAVAAMNGIDFLITWNFAHLNNAFTRSMIRDVIEEAGFDCPEICSPDEIFGE